jgi:hypothetical protein
MVKLVSTCVTADDRSVRLNQSLGVVLDGCGNGSKSGAQEKNANNEKWSRPHMGIP